MWDLVKSIGSVQAELNLPASLHRGGVGPNRGGAERCRLLSDEKTAMVRRHLTSRHPTHHLQLRNAVRVTREPATAGVDRHCEHQRGCHCACFHPSISRPLQSARHRALPAHVRGVTGRLGDMPWPRDERASMLPIHCRPPAAGGIVLPSDALLISVACRAQATRRDGSVPNADEPVCLHKSNGRRLHESGDSPPRAPPIAGAAASAHLRSSCALQVAGDCEAGSTGSARVRAAESVRRRSRLALSSRAQHCRPPPLPTCARHPPRAVGASAHLRSSHA